MKLTRRRLACLGAGTVLAAGTARAAGHADLTLILMGDLHSGYAWSSRLLAAIRQAALSARGEVRIVVNGDVFEHNNAVSRRNDGRIDLALIRAFAGIAPTIVTIGNHDSDLFDPREFAARITQAGATVLTDIVDPRDGRPYGPASMTVTVAGRKVTFAALGTPVLALYPPQYRAAYGVPDPEAYAANRLPALFGDADLPVALVHAGFLADRTVLPHLSGAFLLHGSHDHLRFSQKLGQGLHLHSGAWSNAFQVVTVRFQASGPVMSVRDVVLDTKSPQDPPMQRLVADQRRQNLQPADRAVLGHLPHALGLDASVLRAAGWVRVAADAEIGLLSHTTFGDGLPAGPVSAENLASFMRFDGGISIGEIPRARLAGVIARSNQFDGSTPYARRTGDYLYATAMPAAAARDTVKVAINSYAVSTPANRIAMLGWDAQGFAPALSASGSTLTLGHIISDGLAAA
ncbi:hypothetical protein HN018_05570 [Lichenicola cladoniae]|uniref:Calcineurin-like phosphoesterase domain-containing protein n=1 Tax=Lichenicola cladoniae TaxID=1484109 RepID=A0A6M8HMF4_9PROT|nr:metallophosphoesterase [Lichenicola cladoniae]NPD67040.1 hypothetical protein [Acetobacteraceae bacterium]QKE89583.1 hypothetical protein HN018_05570 [Lichenicola cladoniae]